MLSKKCKYALKALRRLAINSGKVMKSHEIAAIENVPPKFLEHILMELKKDGYIASRQGSGGGYYLLMPAKKIKISEIYRMFDGAIALLPCASEKYYRPCEDCLDASTCTMKILFNDIRNKTYKLLEQKSIYHLIGRPI